MTGKDRAKIKASLENLSRTDTYSLMMFTLYKMKEIPQYASLCELAYILDGDNLSKLLSYYGGMTIRIPTLREMRVLLQALLIFEYVNLNGGTFEDALKASDDSEFSPAELKEAYKHILEVTANYEFSRE